MNKRKTGEKYEEIATQWLLKQGVRILERNFRCRFGEIDVIGRHEGYLIFIEVKYRADNSKGYPSEAVGLSKQKTICKVADFYRTTKKYTEDHPVRYDVIDICGNDLKWYQNAFLHINRYC